MDDQRPTYIQTAQGVIIGDNAQQTNYFGFSSQQRQEHQNRRLMLDKVQNIRIDSVLGKTLPGVLPLVLDLYERSDSLVNQSKSRFQQMDSPRPIPSTQIAQMYESSGSALLIVGKSGSGKTTLLLQLARELIERARRDGTLPMPVIFNLSSWSLTQQSLAHWLVEELENTYHIEPPIAQSWVKNNQLQLIHITVNMV